MATTSSSSSSITASSTSSSLLSISSLPSKTSSPLSISASSSTASSTSSSLLSISSLPSTTSSPPSISASSSSTSPSIPTQGGPRSQHHYGAGAVAGIVIAVALGTAALAILGTWFLMRRRWSRDPENLTLIAVQPKTEPGAGEAGGHASMINLDDILHQQSDHSTIKNTVETLRDLIKQYVDNYVHTNSVTNPESCCSTIEGAIGEFFGKDGSYKSSFLAKLLVSPKTRPDAMRHIIALTFLSSIELSGQLLHSLLPREIVDLIRRFPEQEAHQKAALLAFSKWRCITAFLLSPPGAPLAAQSEQGSTMVVEFLERISKPFVDRHNEEREEVLAALVKRAADLGLLLFEQPTAWEFDWKSPASSSQQAARGKSFQGQQSIVIFPALIDGGLRDGTVTKPLLELLSSD